MPTKRERIKKLMQPREMVVYEASQHTSAYIIPSFIAIAGLLFLLPIDYDYTLLPERFQEMTQNSVVALREYKFGIILLIIGVLELLKTYRSAKNDIKIITNLRVICVTGGLRKKVQDMGIFEVGKVKVKSNFFQKIMFSGKIIITSKKKDKVIELPKISEPKAFIEKLNIVIRKTSNIQ